MKNSLLNFIHRSCIDKKILNSYDHNCHSFLIILQYYTCFIMSSNEDSDLEEAAERALGKLIPAASRLKYEKAYEELRKWCESKHVKEINEKKLLAYFDVHLGKVKASTAWSTYSMLKKTLRVKENIDISTYNNLRELLKRKEDDYFAKKSKILTLEEIYRFIKEAPDEIYLVTKVALIIGVYGACRRSELLKMSVNHIEYGENYIRIVVPKTKTRIDRDFFIDVGGDPDVNLIAIVKRYAALRPPSVTIERFFLGYRKGKCISQPIGINTFGGYPKAIAVFLNLQSPSEYTGHCFRRSAASRLAEAGTPLIDIKRHCGWESDRVAEGYIVRSENNKRKLANNIMGANKRKKTDVPTAQGNSMGAQTNCAAIPSTSSAAELNEQLMGETMKRRTIASDLTDVELGGQLLDRHTNHAAIPVTLGNSIGGQTNRSAIASTSSAAELNEQMMGLPMKRIDIPSTSDAGQFNEEFDESIFRCFSQVVCENNDNPITESLNDENCAPGPAENFTIVSSQTRKAVPSANTFSHLQHCTFNIYQK
ncbi:uncharacterized protein LOC119077677 [Bradysia coprophila]|uniref:uncharacterized protein LOC119076828 n=1 Tax=Bradysia coprophila TaxID=38358 RepID=UPI00187DCC39|nr:uncharacterized protein LOC119076828 [Bradysia coprophila]XP_037039724.1 uncharacterized protein LOC119076829 [Bradysia coprophila]XP_037040825.1 uncharacterized protein LOC119077677 [Bradysia coprophila]